MNCSHCQHDAHHIIDIDGGERCEFCGGFSVSSGQSVSGTLTRNSYRVRRQQSRYEGDMVQPHVWDKTRRKHIINPDYLKLYANKAKDMFTEREMVDSGYAKLPKYAKRLKARNEQKANKVKREVTFEGDAKAGMKRIIGDAQ